MPKFTCGCGFVINLSSGSSPCEFLLLPESSIEDIAKKMDDGLVVSADSFFEKIDGVGVVVYRCPSCDRIHIEEAENRFSSYLKE